MMSNKLGYFDILAAKQAYAEGKNVTELLRVQKNYNSNTSEIIETAYDLQAGSYIKFVEENATQAKLYTSELAAIINDHIIESDYLLDVGTGELTTFSLVCKLLQKKPKRLLAFDLSWSRVYRGLDFASSTMIELFSKLTPFVGDMKEIPLLNKSVDVCISSHALEPNGGVLELLMAELFRVTKKKLLLFEPCYEINSPEGKARMDKLGYIKNVEDVVKKLGGRLDERVIIENVNNPLNPTVCYVITPPPVNFIESVVEASIFSVPGANMRLDRVDGFYFSNDTGLCFPILKNIPILKSSCAILASSLCVSS